MTDQAPWLGVLREVAIGSAIGTVIGITAALVVVLAVSVVARIMGTTG
jgi:hypothetical protein